MRAYVARVLLLVTVGMATVAVVAARPPLARAEYPAGGTYTCDRVDYNGDKFIATGYGCTASGTAPARGPVDKFFIDLSDGSAHFYCAAGIATIGMAAAPDDVLGNGCEQPGSPPRDHLRRSRAADARRQVIHDRVVR